MSDKDIQAITDIANVNVNKKFPMLYNYVNTQQVRYVLEAYQEYTKKRKAR